MQVFNSVNDYYAEIYPARTRRQKEKLKESEKSQKAHLKSSPFSEEALNRIKEQILSDLD